jgi:hypothetical protein
LRANEGNPAISLMGFHTKVAKDAKDADVGSGHFAVFATLV